MTFSYVWFSALHAWRCPLLSANSMKMGRSWREFCLWPFALAVTSPRACVCMCVFQLHVCVHYITCLMSIDWHNPEEFLHAFLAELRPRVVFIWSLQPSDNKPGFGWLVGEWFQSNCTIFCSAHCLSFFYIFCGLKFVFNLQRYIM